MPALIVKALLWSMLELLKGVWLEVSIKKYKVSENILI